MREDPDPPRQLADGLVGGDLGGSSPPPGSGNNFGYNGGVTISHSATGPAPPAAPLPPPVPAPPPLTDAVTAFFAAVRSRSVRAFSAAALRLPTTRLISGVRDGAGHTAAHWAALDGSSMLLELLLLSDPAAVDTPSTSTAQGGQTPLMWAAVGGRLQATLLLLRGGASVGARDERGYDATAHAAQYGHVAVLYALLGGGASPASVDADGHTPLHWAAYMGHHGAVTALCLLGGSLPDVRDGRGMTPLLRASERGHALAVLALLGAGADPNGASAEGVLPRVLADTRGHERVVMAFDTWASLGRGGGTPFVGGRGDGTAGTGGWASTFGQRRLAGVPLRQLPVVIGYWVVLAASLVTYFAWVVPTLGRTIGPSALHPVAVLVTSVASLATGARTTFGEAGLLPQGTPTTFRRRLERALAAASTPPAVRGGDTADSLAADAPATTLLSPSRFCYTCLATRPPRSKHDASTDRCISRYDHYCPWVGGPVGAANHRWLLAFGVATFAAEVLFVTAAGKALWVVHVIGSGGTRSVDGGWVAVAAVLTTLHTLIGAFVAGLLATQAQLIGRNLTTNEAVARGAGRLATAALAASRVGRGGGGAAAAAVAPPDREPPTNVYDLGSRRRNCLAFWRADDGGVTALRTSPSGSALDGLGSSAGRTGGAVVLSGMDGGRGEEGTDEITPLAT